MSDLLILGWHNVESTWFFPNRPGSGRRGLGRQLDVIRRFGNVVPLTAALDALRAGDALPRRSVALTFDDGYRDALVAATVLEQRGVTATFFLVPEFLSRDAAPWWETLARAVMLTARPAFAFDGVRYGLPDLRTRRAAVRAVAQVLRGDEYTRRAEAMAELLDQLGVVAEPHPASLLLDWDGARELVQRGHTVGSHSLAHRTLSRQPADEQRRDLSGARAVLQRRLGVAVDTLAYPYGNPGDFDATTRAAAAQAGYRYAVSTVPGVNGRDASWLCLRRQLLEAAAGRHGLLPIRHSFGGGRAIARLAPHPPPVRNAPPGDAVGGAR